MDSSAGCLFLQSCDATPERRHRRQWHHAVGTVSCSLHCLGHLLPLRHQRNQVVWKGTIYIKNNRKMLMSTPSPASTFSKSLLAKCTRTYARIYTRRHSHHVVSSDVIKPVNLPVKLDIIQLRVIVNIIVLFLQILLLGELRSRHLPPRLI